MKKFLALLICMLSLSRVACAEISDDFCWKYFATLNRNENIFYSPYGINAALSILANGASGDTRQEILNALAANNVEALNDAHKNFSALVEKNYDDKNIFMESNLLLVDKKIIGQGLNQNFQSVVTNIYNSEVRAADFAGNLAGEKEKISRFVNDKTNGFITNYKSIATAATLTDLLNVVYFKGDWAMPFDALKSAKHTFKNRDGSKVKVDMMNQSFKERIAYRADETFKAIALPYKRGSVMYLILPVDDNALNVAELWNAATPSYRADFLDALKNSSAFDGEVIVRLPKFELDIENSLVENLKAMGMTKSFSNAAEFFNIVNGESLKIDNAQHRAKVKVDEKGTEAAAITEFAMVATAMPPEFQPPKVYFRADRPFLFMIRDVESGVTLFAGVVNQLKN